MSDDGKKEVADKEAQTEFTFSSTDTESAVDFQLRNRAAHPPQDDAGTSEAEEVPPEPAEPEPEPEPVAEGEVADGEVESGVFDVDAADAPLEEDEDELPDGEPVAVEEAEGEEAEGEVVEDKEVKGEEVEGEEVEGNEVEGEEVEGEAAQVVEDDEDKPEEFEDAVETVQGEEVEVESEVYDEGDATSEGAEGEAEERNENDKETQTVFGYHPDDSLTEVIEELRAKSPHDDGEPFEEVPVVEKPSPPPPVVLTMHLLVETGTERIPLDLEITIDNLGAVKMTPHKECSPATGEDGEKTTQESAMQTALSFHDTEQNLPEMAEVPAEVAAEDAAEATAPAEGTLDVDDYNFLGLLDTASVASDLSRDVYSPDLMTDEDLMVEPDLVPDQYMEALQPLSDTDVASFVGDESEFPDVAISRVNSIIKTSSTLQVTGPATIHWGLVLPPAADGVSARTTATGSFSGVSMISTIHQLRHENAVSHLDRIDIDDAGSHSTASSFFSLNGDPLPEELYAVRTRVIFQIRSTVGEQRSTDGRFSGATPISLHLETPLPTKPSMHIATVELGEDSASPSHVTFVRDAAESTTSLAPGAQVEFSVEVDECPTAGIMRLVAQLDGEMIAEPIDMRDCLDRVMRLDRLEVTARLVSEPAERKSALKKDDERTLRAARVTAVTCTLDTGPDGQSYSQAMEPSGSPMQFYLPVAGGAVRATLAVIAQPEPEPPEVPEQPDEPEEAAEVAEMEDTEDVEVADVEVELAEIVPEEKDSQGEMFIGELLDEMMEEMGRTAHTPASHPASVEAVAKPQQGSGLIPERVGVDGDRCRDRAYEMIVSALEAYEQGIAPLTDALLEISRKAKELGVAAADGDMPYESSTSLVSLHRCLCHEPDRPGCTPLSKVYNAAGGYMQRGGDSRQYLGGRGGRRQQGYPRQQDAGAFCYRQGGGGFGQPVAGGFRFGHQFYGMDRGSEVWGGRRDSSDECDLCRPRCSLLPLSPLPSKPKMAAPRSPTKSGSLLATTEPSAAEPEPPQEPEEEMASSNLDEPPSAE